MAYIHDAEGWRVQSFPLSSRQGGVLETPTYWAISPDGQTLSVIDTRRYALAIYDLSNLRVPPLVIGQRGRNNGQFNQPTAVAVDAMGRSYVADKSNHNVSVFGKDGSFLFRFGTYTRSQS